MIFLTVGNRYPFDRLVRAVDALIADGVVAAPVIAQIGEGSYEPAHMEWARYFDGDTYDGHVRSARALVGHAGSGTIATALALMKPLLVMPRLVQHKEHVNDHQVDTARTFASLGSVLAAYSDDDLRTLLPSLEQFVPHRREPDVRGLVDRVAAFLTS